MQALARRQRALGQQRNGSVRFMSWAVKPAQGLSDTKGAASPAPPRRFLPWRCGGTSLMADGCRGSREKTEGMSPPRPQARTCVEQEVRGGCGSKPGKRTQRFVPGPGSSRGVWHQPPAIEGAWVLMPKGPDRSSRAAEALSFPRPAGAANQSGHFETLSTMSPPFRFGCRGYSPRSTRMSRIVFLLTSRKAD